LNYELDTYLDALKGFPSDIEKIETESGVAYLQKTDIFKRLIWFAYKGSSVFHPLTPERVIEISELNKIGQKPADLGAVQLTVQKVDVREEFTDVVGQVSLDSLERKTKKKKKHKRKSNFSRRGGPPSKPNPQS
jgi:hypothetical protein